MSLSQNINLIDIEKLQQWLESWKKLQWKINNNRSEAQEQAIWITSWAVVEIFSISGTHAIIESEKAGEDWQK